jgi:hypothetical protein
MSAGERSAPREAEPHLGAVVARALRVRPLVVVVVALCGAPLVFASWLYGLGVPFLSMLFAVGMRDAQRAARGSTWRRTLAALPGATTFALCVSSVIFVAHTAARTEAVLLALVFGVALAPLRIASGAGEPAFVAPLARTLDVCGRRPMVVLAAGAIDGLLTFAFPAFVAHEGTDHLAYVLWFVAPVVGCGAHLAWTLSAFDVLVRRAANRDGAEAASFERAVLAPSVALACAAIAFALARPLPIWHAPTPDELAAPVIAHANYPLGTERSDALDLRRETGLSAVAEGHSTLVLTTNDGERTTVELEHGPFAERSILVPTTLQEGLDARRVTFRGHDAYALGTWLAISPESARDLVVDDHGARLDDTLLDRAARRIFWQAPLAFGLLAIVCLVLTCVEWARSARQERAVGHDAGASSHERRLARLARLARWGVPASLASLAFAVLVLLSA